MALSRTVVDCDNEAGAEAEAVCLLEIWSTAGASHARVLNLDGEILAEVRLRRSSGG